MSIPHLVQHRRRPTRRERLMGAAVGILIVLVCLVVGISGGVGLGALLIWFGSIG